MINEFLEFNEYTTTYNPNVSNHSRLIPGLFIARNAGGVPRALLIIARFLLFQGSDKYPNGYSMDMTLKERMSLRESVIKYLENWTGFSEIRNYIDTVKDRINSDSNLSAEFVKLSKKDKEEFIRDYVINLLVENYDKNNINYYLKNYYFNEIYPSLLKQKSDNTPNTANKNTYESADALSSDYSAILSDMCSTWYDFALSKMIIWDTYDIYKPLSYTNSSQYATNFSMIIADAINQGPLNNRILLCDPSFITLIKCANKEDQYSLKKRPDKNQTDRLLKITAAYLSECNRIGVNPYDSPYVYINKVDLANWLNYKSYGTESHFTDYFYLGNLIIKNSGKLISFNSDFMKDHNFKLINVCDFINASNKTLNNPINFYDTILSEFNKTSDEYLYSAIYVDMGYSSHMQKFSYEPFYFNELEYEYDLIQQIDDSDSDYEDFIYMLPDDACIEFINLAARIIHKKFRNLQPLYQIQLDEEKRFYSKLKKDSSFPDYYTYPWNELIIFIFDIEHNNIRNTYEQLKKQNKTITYKEFKKSRCKCANIIDSAELEVSTILASLSVNNGINKLGKIIQLL